MRKPFVSKPDESSMSVQEEDQLLEIALKLQMTAALKLRSTQLCQCSGLRSWRKTRISPPQRLKAYYHFQHPICVKRIFLQWQQPKQNNGITWT